MSVSVKPPGFKPTNGSVERRPPGRASTKTLDVRQNHEGNIDIIFADGHGIELSPGMAVALAFKLIRAPKDLDLSY